MNSGTPDITLPAGLRVAVILPSYNESIAIGPTVKAFQDALPNATIYVYDNNSSDDNSACIARHLPQVYAVEAADLLKLLDAAAGVSVADEDRRAVRRALDRVKGQATLTVGETASFLRAEDSEGEELIESLVSDTESKVKAVEAAPTPTPRRP